MLKQRVITAIALITLALLAIFYLPLWGFKLVAAGVCLFAVWEWSVLAGLVTGTQRVFCLIAMAFVVALFNVMPVIILLGLGVLTWLVLCYFVFRHLQFAEIWQKISVWARAGLGVWILGITWVSLFFIREQAQGASYLLLLLLWIWGADTGAYFIGRRWGKHKLAPSLSPGKTWEGVMGGSATTFAIACCTGIFFAHSLAYYAALLFLAVMISIISVFGDLFESLLKRQSGVKDSGRWLPGHGGVLDRLDSLFSSAPLFALGLWLFNSLS